MKNIIKTGFYKYILIAIISVLISGVTLLANEKQTEKQVTIDNNTARLEEEIDIMGTAVEELQKEIESMKGYIKVGS